jgi:hypothetical protein
MKGEPETNLKRQSTYHYVAFVEALATRRIIRLRPRHPKQRTAAQSLLQKVILTPSRRPTNSSSQWFP